MRLRPVRPISVLALWVRPERRWFAIPLALAIGLIAAAFYLETTFEKRLQACQSILTSLVIVIGGVWFLERRRHFPRAEISHAVSAVSRDGRVILLVQVKVVNKGDLKISLVQGKFEVQSVPNGESPLVEGELEGKPREVEGGEAEEIWKEILLPADVEHVRVYTCIKNEFRTDDTHWDKSTYFWLKDGKTLG